MKNEAASGYEALLVRCINVYSMLCLKNLVHKKIIKYTDFLIPFIGKMCYNFKKTRRATLWLIL